MSMRLYTSRERMRQVGVLIFSPRMNVRHWIESAKARGYQVLILDGYAEYWTE